MRSPATWIREMQTGWTGWADVSRAVVYNGFMSALRSFWTGNFFSRPRMDKTVVTYDLARSLYRNDNPRYNLGAGFIRPIIDLTVEYMGLPGVSCDHPETDAWLADCISEHWGPQLQQIFRDSIRDSKVIVRFRQPMLDNPLFTEEDREHGRLQLIPPEECQITYDPSDPDRVERAVITHWVEIDVRDDDEIIRGTMPRFEEHEIIEVIDAKAFTFYDKTAHTTLPDWTTPNNWGFVPVWEVWNEYAADLGGGQSDIEPILPFIEAFHQVLGQTLAAHTYHSTPKVKFKLKDVRVFLKNNWPDVLDDNGNVKAGASIDWSGRQVMFFQADEDADFIEAKSVLGDSKTLMEFLIECICIASETPRWALLSTILRTPDNDATVQPFEKKIGRKRVAFSEPLQMIFKMALAANGKIPYTVRVTWAPVRVDELASKGQAIQQIILGLDVAAQHEWIADDTVIKIIGSLFEEVSAPNIEKKLAADNVIPALPAPAPASGTQALPPPKSGSNGSGSKKSAQKALATTKASQS
jgi:hypothetical protein